ncbi:hypothetical protein [Paraburkholderia sp. J10-1]|uniref:hypothetical protein n=1 Tax=Paraburkholderia sp. J10-1 TaxID=2805430 RepID=UPI002AB78908|nr:hypothetical protein [Paraburkholderia sp. J10-1]
MSTPFDDRLYNLLPSVYRQRDADFGQPLRALLAVIAEQVDAVEQDIAALYDNWFIETCADWVVPYLGDLIGYRTLNAPGAQTSESPQRAAARGRILFPRRDVANTLRYRRRKGSLALLDELAAAVSGWPAHAVEFAPLIAATQSLDHLRPGRGGTAAVRGARAMDHIGLVSDETAHLVDLRRPQSRFRQGRYAPASVGLFVWRLKSYGVGRTEAYCVEEVGPHCYTFSVLGNDAPLFAAPDASGTQGTSGASVPPWPVMLRRADIAGDDGHVDPRYYGEHRSFALWTGGESAAPFPVGTLRVADLSDWRAAPARGTAVVDPECGRIMFAPGEAPERGLFVSYHYGSPADIGGGPYPRPLAVWVPPPAAEGEHAEVARYTVGSEGDFRKLHEALHAWHEEKPRFAVIEIAANDVFTEPVRIALEEGQSLEVRAANRARPVIRLLDIQTHRPDYLAISGAAKSRLVLDGLLVTGRGVQVKGELAHLTIRHCTFVPGWEVERQTAAGNTPRAALPSTASSAPSLMLVRTRARVTIEHSILGPIHVSSSDPEQEPLQLAIRDSVIDARSARNAAVGAAGAEGDEGAHVALTIARCTVFGIVRVNALTLAENCIFNDGIAVERRHTGCVRFCYVSPRARTPRRYRCQPDSAMAGQQGTAREAAEQRVRPVFNSMRFGSPAYCQLAGNCAPEIVRGADDESEMGVFHDLYEPQRMENLLTRLEEYVPADADVGIVVVN